MTRSLITIEQLLQPPIGNHSRCIIFSINRNAEKDTEYNTNAPKIRESFSLIINPRAEEQRLNRAAQHSRLWWQSKRSPYRSIDLQSNCHVSSIWDCENAMHCHSTDAAMPPLHCMNWKDTLISQTRVKIALINSLQGGEAYYVGLYRPWSAMPPQWIIKAQLQEILLFSFLPDPLHMWHEWRSYQQW